MKLNGNALRSSLSERYVHANCARCGRRARVADCTHDLLADKEDKKRLLHSCLKIPGHGCPPEHFALPLNPVPHAALWSWMLK